MTVIEKPQALPAAAPAPLERDRSYWVDNLRTLTILLVVNMHACVTYSYVGGWYYNAPPEPPLTAKIPFLLWQGHLQAFFMGLMFFIAGFYADRSLARRGSASFVKERLRRLGIPTLLYMIVLHPLIVMGLHPGYAPSDQPLKDYVHFIVSGKFIGSSGPMWFALAALIFSLAFVSVYRFLPAAIPSSKLNLRARQTLLLGALLGVCSFLIRTSQPVGSSVLNFQLCYFSQYIVAFGLGIWISRKDWLTQIAQADAAKKIGIAACILGPLALVAVAASSLPSKSGETPAFVGGWNWHALTFALWEQITGVALAVGFMSLCFRKLNVRTKLSNWLSERSFGVYWIHPPILVGLALLFQPHRIEPISMSLLLTVTGVALSFLASDIARRAPLLKSIL